MKAVNLLLLLLLSGAAVGVPLTKTQVAVGAVAGVAVASAAAVVFTEKKCEDVTIPEVTKGSPPVCAVLFDEENCKLSSDNLSLKGDEGILPLATTGLRR